MLFSAIPPAQGLYDPLREADACGVAVITDLHGRASRRVVTDALTALANLGHRGATGAEPTSGDGAGLLVQLPDRLLRDEVAGLPEPDPAGGHRYAAGVAFLPTAPSLRGRARTLVAQLDDQEGLEVLGWRELGIDPDGAGVGPTARGCQPHLEMLLIAGRTGSAGGRPAGVVLDRLAFCLRRRVERDSVAVGAGTYFASLSARTLVYKGMLTATQLPAFFADLRDERLQSAIALVHSRFSTNTFPSWPLAQPFRYAAHNGEINTIRGNRNRMRAREALLRSALIPGDLQRLYPICTEGVSDSASFDEVLELLHLGGRSLPHAVLMMIPEAWESHPGMDPAVRAFYRFHASMMEPWDGPAAVTFTDGTLVGAVLDRNGLRPARWWRTTDDRVVLASETGVLDVPPAQVVAKGRLQPGRMFLVDTAAGEIVEDDVVKAALAAEHPYREWVHAGLVRLARLPDRQHPDRRDVVPGPESVLHRQVVFGYTDEELRVLLAPMAVTGAEPVGSMGSDTPVAALARRPRLLYDYFVQLFAQVTNPPLDAIREQVVTSMTQVAGLEQNLLQPGPASCRHLELPRPVIDNAELAKIVSINADGDLPGFACAVLPGLFDVQAGAGGLADALQRVREQASKAIANGARILVLSDRGGAAARAPIPSLLLVSAVHQHLVRVRQRARVALVAEAGDAREVHHVALLLGYGAAAVNPYLAFETIEELAAQGALGGVDARTGVRRYVTALVKGVLKVMSKMGVSTVGGYTAAQIFEAVGLSRALVDEYFCGTASQLDGVGLDVLAAEVAARHARARGPDPQREVGGEYAYRRDGELHLFSPETVFLLQHATRSGRREVYRAYTEEVDRLSHQGGTLRGLLRLRTGVRKPVPLHEVEPASAILRRFATGAMSYGSLSAEAHETLAIAMNRLGGRSNCGEGGEDADRLHHPLRRSAVKQVASGRFGVTSEYLVSASDIQIKMAQGAKPGEGGQLPGFKVHPWIARTRHATPGVTLISPPPHHDIYSIEDLAQLIHDLKNANERARVHVKLVSSVGVGTVAAGVAKAHADVVLISGHDGGTGAAPLTSLKHAGAPWEVGLADTQQTLLLNGLRDRITVQVDGGMRTGRDVVIAALLGAEEYGFATAPLIVAGCVLMRVCHLDTCPVGVATQRPELRARFTGTPEFVEQFFTFVAEEVRELLAELGFATLDEAIGHAELLDTAAAVAHGKGAGLDLAPLFAVPAASPVRRRIGIQQHGLERALDRTLIQLAEAALDDARPVRLKLPIRNVNRTVGTLLGAEVTRRYGADGLPPGTVHIELEGSAGQSLGAFLPRGITLHLIGDANDYLGKGLSGGEIIARPDPAVPFAAEQHVVAGNVIGYGATSGQLWLRGRVGERFCVRNSGALAVAEGVGDHAFEYMTGGRAVVLGPTGRNLAAGMSGGIGYVLDLDPVQVNSELVELQPLGPEDAAWLRAVVARHHELTSSAVAARLLPDWARSAEAFTKVMPVDYERVLEATRRAREAGRDAGTAVMEAARG
ncbi:MAG TPA: glutamate synthase large subunit [Pseudonocardiaceae bacterium]|jgi:glutamate synthase (NADPH/NADH) large chain|nr:glutamate synthase large subunit [Pseudonocardiaceae bacterium]